MTQDVGYESVSEYLRTRRYQVRPTDSHGVDLERSTLGK